MATTIQQIELPKKARAVDTSGNNNHGQIYSGRGLEFDGIADYLSIADDASIRPTDSITVVCWIYYTGSGYGTIFGQNYGWTNGVWLAMLSGQLRCELDGAVSHNDFNSPINVNPNTWYRIVMTYNTVDGGVLYMNGEVVDTIAANGSITQPTSSPYQIGGSGTYFFDGAMADFQLWDTTWTAADVTYDYLNPESLALNNSGTALTESNLKLWYPMQDGHRGQQSYILDGANSGLGDEEVTNGDFESGTSGWSAHYSGTLNNTGNALNVVDTGTGGSRAAASITTVIGKTYKFVSDVLQVQSTNTVIAVSNAVNLDGAFINSTITTPTNGVTVYFTATATTTFIGFKRGGGGVGVTNIYDNVSVKAINDKHHATTVFYGDELVTNGDCEVTDPATVTINSVAFTLDDATYDDSAEQANGGSKSLKITADSSSVKPEVKFLDGDAMGLVVGRTYKFSVDAYLPAGLDMDQVRIKAMDNGGSEIIEAHTSTTGSWVALSITFVNDDITSLRVFGYNGGAAVNNESYYIDNVSVKEVGVASGWTDADQQLHIPQTALQSYNELAWFQDNGGASNPHASASNHNDFNPEDGDFTISAWVYQADLHGNNYFFAQGGGGTSGWNTQIDSGGNPRFVIEDDDGSDDGTQLVADGSTAIPTGEFFHFVGVINRTTDYIHVYINGVEQDSTDISSINNPIEHSSGVLKFGSWSGGYTNGVMNGTATEFSIFKGVAFSQAEINELYNDGKALDATTHSQIANLKGYWRNDGLNTTWKNINNPGTHDATFSNGTETILIPQGVDSTRDAQGFIMNKQKSTSCLNFTSKGDKYVRVQDSPTVQLAGTAASWVFWVKLDSLSDGDQKLMSKAPSTGNPSSAYQIRTNNDDLLFQIYSGSWRTDTRSDFFTSTGWTHVVVTIDSSNNVNFYKNGDVFGSEADIGYAVPANTGGLHVGARVQSTGVYDEFLKGQIDGVLLYNKELDSTEVLRNYNATKGNHRN